MRLVLVEAGSNLSTLRQERSFLADHAIGIMYSPIQATGYSEPPENQLRVAWDRLLFWQASGFQVGYRLMANRPKDLVSLIDTIINLGLKPNRLDLTLTGKQKDPNLSQLFGSAIRRSGDIGDEPLTLVTYLPDLKFEDQLLLTPDRDAFLGVKVKSREEARKVVARSQHAIRPIVVRLEPSCLDFIACAHDPLPVQMVYRQIDTTALRQLSTLHH